MRANMPRLVCNDKPTGTMQGRARGSAAVPAMLMYLCD